MLKKKQRMSENERDCSEKHEKLQILFIDTLKVYSVWWSEQKEVKTNQEYKNEAFHHA